ncbi:MAG: cytochrome d ubiquinol oxidase subunit II [Actinobacteria bacterium]|nr:cytochrome d ubiquinol oxidase subunit II [Actinomycetota bacterium]
MKRQAWRLIRIAMLAATITIAGAGPAAAHQGGVEPSNYRTEILSVKPDLSGVELRVIDLGDRLELRNDTERDVFVIGYDDEPYLRIGPRGTFENRRSPAVYLNQTRDASDPIPEFADPERDPVWRRISDAPVARWHDHRAHWMGGTDPRTVQRAPDDRHLVQRFTIVLQADGERVRVRGDVTWIPGPSPWPWVLGALAAGGVVVLVARSRAARVGAGTALVALLGAQSVHIVTTMIDTTEPLATMFVPSLLAVGGLILAVVAIVMLLRQGLDAAAPFLLIAGLAVGITGGLADVLVLGHSQVPASGPAWITRLAVSTALGVGAGLMIVGIIEVQRGAPGRRRTMPARSSP